MIGNLTCGSLKSELVRVLVYTSTPVFPVCRPLIQIGSVVGTVCPVCDATVSFSEEVRCRPPPRRRPSGRRLASSGPGSTPATEADQRRQRAISSSSQVSLTASELASEDGGTLTDGGDPTDPAVR